jgi:hypothetical protein
MDDGDVIKLLDYQIRNSYGNVFWTHKIHEKDADMYNKYDSRLKVAQIILSAVSTTGLISVLLGISNSNASSPCWIIYLATVISTIVSAALLVINSLQKGYSFSVLAAQHADAALKLLNLREDYLSLLYDIKGGFVDVDKIKSRRDDLQKRTVEVYESAPRTTAKGYEKAEESIKSGEHFYTKESLNQILPPELREE